MSIFKLTDSFYEKVCLATGQNLIKIEITVQYSSSERWTAVTSVFRYTERNEQPCVPFWGFWPDNGTGSIPIQELKGTTEFDDLSKVQRAGEPEPYEAQAYLNPTRKYETETLADLVAQLKHDGTKITIKADSRTVEKIPFASTDIKGVKYIL